MKILESLENVSEFCAEVTRLSREAEEWKNKYISKDILYKDAFERWHLWMKLAKENGLELEKS